MLWYIHSTRGHPKKMFFFKPEPLSHFLPAEETAWLYASDDKQDVKCCTQSEKQPVQGVLLDLTGEPVTQR